jgi:predicted nucleic acid-binding protein
MLVVADTSPINYLILLDQDTLLPRLYDQVVIPPAVHGELQHPQTPPAVRAWVAHPPPWFEVRHPQQRLEAAQFPKLGVGEREAIALAQELHVPLLLMDDPEGREEATRRALRTTGTLGVLEQAAIDGLLDLPTVLTQLLTTTTFRAGAYLIQDLLARDAARKANPPTDGR